MDFMLPLTLYAILASSTNTSRAGASHRSQTSTASSKTPTQILILPTIPCKGLMNQLRALAEVIVNVVTCTPLCDKKLGQPSMRTLVLPPFHTACYHWDAHDNYFVDFSEWLEPHNFTAAMQIHGAYFMQPPPTLNRRVAPKGNGLDSRQEIAAALNLSVGRIRYSSYALVREIVHGLPSSWYPRMCYPRCPSCPSTMANATVAVHKDACQFSQDGAPEPAVTVAMRRIWTAFHTALHPGRAIRPYLEPLHTWLQAMLPPGQPRHSHVVLHLRFEELSGTKLAENAVRLFGYAGGREHGLKSPSRLVRLLHGRLRVPRGSLIYVVTGEYAEREADLKALRASPGHYRVVTKEDLFHSLLESLDVGREERALIDYFMTSEARLFVGHGTSTFSQAACLRRNALAARDGSGGSGSRPTHFYEQSDETFATPAITSAIGHHCTVPTAAPPPPSSARQSSHVSNANHRTAHKRKTGP